MDPVIRSLYERKSVRVFTERKISEEDVRIIAEAAVQAPTAGNQQLYTIIRVTDPEKKHALSISCDHQPFIEEADLVLVFCADCLRWYRAYEEAGIKPRKPGEGDLMLAVCDALIAAQNAVTAAQALGIGSCYIGDIMENAKTQREILGLPSFVFPAAMLVFGYPTDQQKERQKPRRLDLSYVLQENTYHEHTGEELRKMFEERTGIRSYDEWMKAFYERKYNSDFAREMTRSVREFLEEYRQD
ncbi:MAG: nitroreductase family protein [Lachnospiraceae bacterium]|nr:nitroreductase family protein [Lachnospiraceae bacterium]